MISKKLQTILNLIGLPNESVKFSSPPQTTYLVYIESLRCWGSDDKNRIAEHNVAFEVYSYDYADEDAYDSVRTVLNESGLPFTQNETLYLNSENLFMAVFNFTFLEKKPPSACSAKGGDEGNM